MDANYFLSEFLRVLGGGTILTVVLAFLCRKAIAHWLLKDIEQFKSDLQRTLTAFTNRHSLYCEKQATVIAEVYAGLWKIKDSLGVLGSCSDTEKVEKLFKDSRVVHNEAATYFLHHSIYFPEEMAKKIKTLYYSLMDLGLDYNLRHYIHRGDPESIAHLKRVMAANEEVKAMMTDIEREFRDVVSGKLDG